MSTRTNSSAPSFSLPETLFIVFGMVAMVVIGGVGAMGVWLLWPSFAATAEQTYWFISRSSGVLAYLLLTLAMLWGLIQSGAIMRSTLPPVLAFELHSFLSWAALLTTAIHALVLLGDSYIQMTLAHLLIPFTAPYAPFWVGLGTIALYLMLLLTLSFYARKDIGQQTFRYLHYLSYAIYLLVTLHALGSGTDSGNLSLLYSMSAIAVLVLTLWRMTNGLLKLKKA